MKTELVEMMDVSVLALVDGEVLLRKARSRLVYSCDPAARGEPRGGGLGSFKAVC